MDLGLTILKLCEITPGGILVFFPSYSMINLYYEFWESRGIINQIKQFKGVY
jgi:Rad3-related DNA helicase